MRPSRSVRLGRSFLFDDVSQIELPIIETAFAVNNAKSGRCDSQSSAGEQARSLSPPVVRIIILAEDERQHKTDNAHHQRADECRPEAVHDKAEMEVRRDPARQREH